MTQPLIEIVVDGCALSLWSKDGYEVQHIADDDTVGFAFETQHGVDAIGTEKRRAFRRQANTLSWIPRDCPVFSCSAEGGEYLIIRNITAASAGYPDMAQRPLNGIVDTDAVSAAHLLRRILVRDKFGPTRINPGREDAATTTVHAPLNSSGNRIPQPHDASDSKWVLVSALDVLGATLHHHFHDAKPITPWMTVARLAAIDRLIDREMHTSLTIERLALELDLSAGFLVRAFRQSLGTTPHRYIMERRLAHARRLLSAKAPIAAVAFQCGFTDQAHLTRIMRQSFDVTPSRYRLNR